jgi:peroxiredoxin
MYEALVWVLLALLVLTWFVLYQVVRQNGRMLIRLDHVERDLAGDTDDEPGGLPVGTEVPLFRLRDLAGQEVALEQFRGGRVLLVNWSPACGFCQQIADELATLGADLRKHRTQLVLVAHGGRDANAELAEAHGLQCPILLDEGSAVEAFAGEGTPVAYLIDEHGRVAEPLAVGSGDVPQLARRAARARSVADSRIERDGIEPGTPAPAFRLPGVSGADVSLAEYLGRRVLLVFSDPHCGPCDAVSQDLVRLLGEHRGNGLDVVMVGRGELDENRRKAEELGFEFPVAIQDGWKLSKAYGIFATPVAFLIDEKGVIAERVARGREEIRRLAEKARAGRGKER